MKITDIKFYDGSREKVCKLGLADLYLELQEVLIKTKVNLLEKKDANGAGTLRKLIDKTFSEFEDWEKIVSGGVDWTKRVRYNRTFIAKLGVEIQVSARSDLLIRDIVHLRNSIQEGEIEVGVIVVPNNKMAEYLTDRTPAWKDAVRYIEEEFKEAMTFPIILIGLEHDDISDEPLNKQVTKK